MKPSSRRGITSLVEVLVAISIGSIAFILATVVLARMMRGDREAREHAQQTMVLTRLADQFRTDVHAAQTAKITRNGAGLEMTLPGSGEVSYGWDQGRVRRKWAGHPVRQETYRLGGLKQTAFALEGEAPAMAVLALERKAVEQKAAAQAIRISAAVGRDRRFLADAKGATP